jgi:hypothetical protein
VKGSQTPCPINRGTIFCVMHFGTPFKAAMRAWNSWCNREHPTPWMSRIPGLSGKKPTPRFYKVATIHIPQQTFDTPQQNEFCENLSFTPWHALPEHKPLGVTNRLRKVIYDHISRVRHEINDAKRQEP